MQITDRRQLLPKKKITEISRISQLSKLKDPDKLVEHNQSYESLHSLASEHRIESRLCSGNGIERIYQLPGDNKATRWLSTMCGKSCNDETLWIKLIDFLESGGVKNS